MGRRLLQFVVALVAGMILASLWTRAGAQEGIGTDAFTEGGLTVQIDGMDLQFDPAPYVLPPGRAMVPMRAFFETLGARVEWNGRTQQVTGIRGDRVVTLQIGSTTAYVNGAPVALDAAPEIRHGRTFIPLRFVAESLESTVEFRADRYEITVQSRADDRQTLPLQAGVQMNFRYMLIDLALQSHWRAVVTEAGAFPDPVTFTSAGLPSGEPDLPVTRTLTRLVAGREFEPERVLAHEPRTAPWLSATVFDELEHPGRSERFQVGGSHVNGQLETTLTVQERTHFVLTLNERRVRVPALRISATTGDQFWVLNDPENPLVLKYQPVGLALPGAFGTVGYQLETVTTP